MYRLKIQYQTKTGISWDSTHISSTGDPTADIEAAVAQVMDDPAGFRRVLAIDPIGPRSAAAKKSIADQAMSLFDPSGSTGAKLQQAKPGDQPGVDLGGYKDRPSLREAITHAGERRLGYTTPSQWNWETPGHALQGLTGSILRKVGFEGRIQSGKAAELGTSIHEELQKKHGLEGWEESEASRISGRLAGKPIYGRADLPVVGGKITDIKPLRGQTRATTLQAERELAEKQTIPSYQRQLSAMAHMTGATESEFYHYPSEMREDVPDAAAYAHAKYQERGGVSVPIIPKPEMERHWRTDLRPLTESQSGRAMNLAMRIALGDVEAPTSLAAWNELANRPYRSPVHGDTRAHPPSQRRRSPVYGNEPPAGFYDDEGYDPGVPTEAPPGADRWAWLAAGGHQFTVLNKKATKVEVAVRGRKQGIFHKRIEEVPGVGYKVDGRIVQWQQERLEQGGKLVDPKAHILHSLSSTSGHLDQMKLTRFSSLGDVRRSAQGHWNQQMDIFPGMPANWKYKTDTGTGEKSQWYKWSPAIMARMAAGLQIRTTEASGREPGKWRNYQFPEDVGDYVSRGSERGAEAGRMGRWLAFPTAAFRASSEVFSGGSESSSNFKAGFGAAKAAKRLQLGAQELLPLEDLPITKSPFRMPKVPLPQGGFLELPRERGQAITAAVLLSGVLPEGMGQVDLPYTYEDRVKRTVLPYAKSGQVELPKKGVVGSKTGRYGEMEIGRMPGEKGAAIPYMAGDFESTELLSQTIEKSEGRAALVSKLRQRTQTGSWMSFKGQGQKAYVMEGSLPEQLGTQAVLPTPKNTVGFYHGVLTGASELDPVGFKALKKKHKFGKDWNIANAEKIMAAGDDYVGSRTSLQKMRMSIHESNLAAQQLAVSGGQLKAEDDFVGELLSGSLVPGSEGVWDIAMKKPMYIGPHTWQGRKESYGRNPFVSMEELKQIGENVSKPFAEQLRAMSGATRPYDRVMRAYGHSGFKGYGKPGAAPKSVELSSKEWSSALERRIALEKEVIDPDQRWLQALEETVGNKAIKFRGQGTAFGKKRDIYLPSPKDMKTFSAVSELGEQVSPFVTQYSHLTQMMSEPTSGRSLNRQVLKFSQAYQGLVDAPEFQRRWMGASPRHAIEGPMGADLSLAPREAVLGKEAIADLAGINMSKAGSGERLATFMDTMEKRYAAGDPLIGMMMRRPISDPEGQMGMGAVKLMTERIAKNMTTRNLGRGAATSTYMAGVGRGDWDTDRYMIMLAHEGKVQFQAGKRVFDEYREEPSYDIKTPKWAKKALAQPLPEQLGKRMAAIGGGSKEVFQNKSWWNEMRKWQQANADDSSYQQIMKGRTFEMLESFKSGDLVRSYQNEMLNKEIGMTAPYNMGRGLKMAGADKEATDSFTAIMYQYGLDKKLGFGAEEGPEGLKRIIDLWSTYTPTSAVGRGKRGGFFSKMEKYEPDRLGELTAPWKKSPGGPTGFAAEVTSAMMDITQQSPDDVGAKLRPEHTAALLYGSKYTAAQLRAVKSGEKEGLVAKGGGAWGMMESPGIVRAIAARRAARNADKGWDAPGEWSEGNIKGLIEHGRRAESGIALLSKGRRHPDVVQGLWDLPVEDNWLKQDILGRAGLYAQDPTAWLHSNIWEQGGMPEGYERVTVNKEEFIVGIDEMDPFMEIMGNVGEDFNPSAEQQALVEKVKAQTIKWRPAKAAGAKSGVQSTTAPGSSRQYATRVKPVSAGSRGAAPPDPAAMANINQEQAETIGTVVASSIIDKFAEGDNWKGVRVALDDLSATGESHRISEPSLTSIQDVRKAIQYGPKGKGGKATLQDWYTDPKVPKGMYGTVTRLYEGKETKLGEMSDKELATYQKDVADMQRYYTGQGLKMPPSMDRMATRGLHEYGRRLQPTKPPDPELTGGMADYVAGLAPEQVAEMITPGKKSMARAGWVQAAAQGGTISTAATGVGKKTMEVLGAAVPKAFEAEVQGLIESTSMTKKQMDRTGELFKMMADSPEMQEAAKEMGPKLQGMAQQGQQFREWAETYMKDSGAKDLAGMEKQIKAGQVAPAHMRGRLGALQQIAMKGGRAGTADVPMLARIEKAQEGVQQIELERQAAGGGKLKTAMGNLLQEFSIGGAAIRSAVIGRYTTGMVAGWEQAAMEPGVAGLRFNLAMGQDYEGAMAGSTMGSMIRYQTGVRSYQQARGTQALSARMGMLGMLGVEPSAELGQTVGAIGTPLMSGLGVAGITGVVTSAAGKILSDTGGARALKIGKGISKYAPGVAIGAGLLYGGALAAGEIYQAGDPSNLMREAAEIEMGVRQKPSVWAELGKEMQDVQTGFNEARGNWVTRGFQALEYGTSARSGTAGTAMEAYADTKELRIAQADVYIQEMEGLNLDQTQAREIGALANLAGMGEGAILGGRADEMIRQLAPMAQLGESGQYVGAVQRFAGALGITPGKGMAQYIGALPTGATPAEQAQWQSSAEVLGQIYSPLGQTPGLGAIGELAGRFGEGVPIHQVMQEFRAATGQTPLAQAMGFAGGTPSAMAVSRGQAAMSQAEASMLGQIGSEFGQIADIRGYPTMGKVAYYEQLAEQRRGEELPDGSFRVGMTRSTQRRQQERFAGIGAQVFGFAAGSSQAIEAMKDAPDTALGRAQWQQAAQYAAPAVGMKGWDAGLTTAEYETAVQAGISPTALGLAGQADAGQGAISAAFGGMGFATQLEENLAQGLRTPVQEGGITADQYMGYAQVARQSKTQLGYSLAAIARTGGVPVSGMGISQRGQAYLDIREQAGQPLIEGAQPLVEFGAEGGIYSYGTMQKRALARRQMVQGQQYQMGTGAWQYQAAAGTTFQMGMIGQIGMQEQRLSDFQTSRALRQQMAAQSQQNREAGIYRAMESAGLQYRQGIESLSLSRAMWASGKQYQRTEMGIGYEQMQVRQDWAREDMAYGREVAGREFGWQMEDLDENIKYATGRQKRVLMRQRDRTEERYAGSETQRTRTEGRQEEQMQWEEEAHTRRKNYFEETTAFESQQFAMRRRHLTESYALQMSHLQEQLGEIQANWELQKKLTAVSDDARERELKWGLAQLEQKKEYYEKVVFPGQTEQLEMQEKIADRYAKYAEQQYSDLGPGGVIWEGWGTLVDAVFAWLKSIGAYDRGDSLTYTSGGSRGGHAEGGPVGRGGPYIVGEQGPEIFIPNQPGYIVPNHQIAAPASSGVTIGSMIINVPEGDYTAREVAAEVWMEFERHLNDAARSQKMRGQVWQ